MKKNAGTRFPLARVKKIMQMDEDIGKVATVVPILVAKALEIFAQSLVDSACEEAKSRGAKKILPQHLKACVTKNEQFDFLSDIVEKVQDTEAPEKRGRKKTDDGEGAAEKPRKRRKAAATEPEVIPSLSRLESVESGLLGGDEQSDSP